MNASFNFVALCAGRLAVDHDEVGFSDIKFGADPRSGNLILRWCEYNVQRSELPEIIWVLSSKSHISSMFSTAGVNIPVNGFSSHFSKLPSFSSMSPDNSRFSSISRTSKSAESASPVQKSTVHRFEPDRKLLHIFHRPDTVNQSDASQFPTSAGCSV